MASRTVTTLGLSVLGHVVLAAGAALPAAHEPVALETARPWLAAALAIASSATAPLRIHEARRALIAEARAARAAGRLDLGDFLLRANAIDASEQGREIDLEAAHAALLARTTALTVELARATPLRDAVAQVFADVRYFGRTGGLMADVLADRGGSCEPVAHLLASTILAAAARLGSDRGAGRDSARELRIMFRFWGDDSAGPAHLTVVSSGKGRKEHDLSSGRQTAPGGVAFAPEELVEVYARRHRTDGALPTSRRAGSTATLPPVEPIARARVAAPAAGSASSPEAALPTLAAGYPENRDRWPGSLPIFAARAIHDPSDASDEALAQVAAQQHTRDCAFFLRMALLDPPRLDVDGGPSVELYRFPRASELERQAALLDSVEQVTSAPETGLAFRLMGWACLVGLSERTAVGLTLAGERRLADVAVGKGRRASADARRAIDAVAWDGPAGEALRAELRREFAGRTWLLTVLPGGDRLAFDLVTGAPPEDWGQVNALAGLVVSPATRERAIRLLSGMPQRDQVDVMHEVFHAHDHQRPWATNFALDERARCATGDCQPDAVSEFERAYRVFRAMAWRLWEGMRPVEETLAAMHRELGEARLDARWEGVLVNYYGRNVLGLYRHRADGLDAVRALLDAPSMQRDPSLATLKGRLEYVLAQGRLDAVTISDAWRLR